MCSKLIMFEVLHLLPDNQEFYAEFMYLVLACLYIGSGMGRMHMAATE